MTEVQKYSKATHRGTPSAGYDRSQIESPENDIRREIANIASRTKLTVRRMEQIFLPVSGAMKDDAFNEFEVDVNSFLAENPRAGAMLVDKLLHANGGIQLPKLNQKVEKRMEETQRIGKSGRRT